MFFLSAIPEADMVQPEMVRHTSAAVVVRQPELVAAPAPDLGALEAKLHIARRLSYAVA